VPSIVAEISKVKGAAKLNMSGIYQEDTMDVEAARVRVIANSALMAYLRLLTNNSQTRRSLDTIMKRSCTPIALSEGFSAACALIREDESEEGADIMSART